MYQQNEICFLCVCVVVCFAFKTSSNIDCIALLSKIEFNAIFQCYNMYWVYKLNFSFFFFALLFSFWFPIFSSCYIRIVFLFICFAASTLWKIKRKEILFCFSQWKQLLWTFFHSLYYVTNENWVNHLPFSYENVFQIRFYYLCMYIIITLFISHKKIQEI